MSRIFERFSVHRRRGALGAAATAFAVASCAGDSSKSRAPDSAARAPVSSTSSGADLTGAGATFPFPIYSRWIAEFQARTGVKINYRDIGSGGGIRQLSEQTVDFGASDAPMTDAELANAKGGRIDHVPMIAGAVAIAYNVPQLTQPLKLTGALVADIFLGRVTKWNDSRLAAMNPGASLPASDILVVHRSEGSGTTYIFSDYLSSISPAWKSRPGRGKQLQWPVGLGANGNEGVAGQIKQTPGAVGYVELAYVKQNRLSTALLQNADGHFVAPSASAALAAATAAASSLPPTTDYRVSIVNSPGAESYPIASFSWLLIYHEQPDREKAKKLGGFIRWSLDSGAASASALDYAPLPASLVARLRPRIDSLVGAPSASNP